MSPLLADRVAQTTTASGNGATLDITGGAKLGHRTFGAGVGFGVTTYYAIVHQTSGEWEVGIGTVTDAATDFLNRTTVLDGSSGPGVRVNFAAGTKDVFQDLPASKVIVADSAGLTALPGGLTAAAGAFSGLITVNNGILIATGGGTFAAGTIRKQADDGFQIATITGATNDFALYNPTGVTAIIRVPTGTTGVTFVAGITLADGDVALATGKGIVVGGSRHWTFKAGGELNIDQGANDGQIFSFSSSDVAHGMTSVTTTDTFLFAVKANAAQGGASFQAFSEGTVAMQFVGAGTTDDTTKSTAATGYVDFLAAKKSGTTYGAPGANANLVTIRDGAGTCRFIFDAEGDSHQDVGTAWTNFDSHNDVALLNLLAAKVSRRDDPLRKSFGKWMRHNRRILERAKLVTFNRDGHHFVNMSRLTMLHTGALRQIGARLDRVVETLLAIGVPPALLTA